MKSLNYRLLPVIIFIIAAIFTIVFAKKEIHNFEGKCSTCHLVNQKQEVFKEVFVKEVDFQCNACHNNLGLSHPTGMKPSMEMPEGFVLDSRGRMTCATCHKTHGEKKYLLIYGVPGKSFCYMCHKEGLKDLHGGVGSGAHSISKYEVMNRSVLLDELSIQCLGCHDSTIGGDARIGLGNWRHDSGGSHPIGIDYMQAYSKGGFNHPSLLNKEIKLFNGRLGCGTCHNIYSEKKDKMVMSNRGSTMCLECHRL